MEIDIEEKSEDEIRQGITTRFSSNITYPFSNQLRFSMVVGERFLFIRDTKLEIYSFGSYKEVSDINMSNLQNLIDKYFNYDITPLHLGWNNC
jgi:hypothetical protein